MAENPADLGSRGGNCVESELWRNGPQWLSDPCQWPPNIILEPSPESSAEAKVVRSVFTMTASTRNLDELDEILQAHSLHKTLGLERGCKDSSVTVDD